MLRLVQQLASPTLEHESGVGAQRGSLAIHYQEPTLSTVQPGMVR